MSCHLAPWPHLEMDMREYALWGPCNSQLLSAPRRLGTSEQSTVKYFLLKILFIYSGETQREREAETRQREKKAPCGEPDVGLYPRTPGSHPGPKADAKPLSHPSVPTFTFLS